MNKKVIVIGAIIIVVIVAFFVFLIISNNASTTPGVGTSTSTGTGLPVSTTTPVVVGPTPTTTSITLGTSDGNVTMNNFYKTANTITQDKQAVIIEDAGDYVITYNVPDSSFAIALQSTPLDTARSAAESAFLSELGISQADACKLTVYEGVPISVSDQYPGETFPLSFCGGPATL